MDKIVEYTPAQPKQEVVQPTYELKKDVTGKPSVKRGPIVMKDSQGKTYKLPFPPKTSCNKCYGRGYIGHELKTNKLLICKKCFPLMQ